MSGRVGRQPAPMARNNRQAIWDIFEQDLTAWWTLTELSRAAKVNSKTTSDYLGCLEAADLLETSHNPESGVREFRLLRYTGVLAPRLRTDGSPVTQGAGVENMWRTMRMMAQFSPRDITIHATTDEVTVKSATAASYLSFLYRTGYLRRLQKAVPGRQQAIYRLIRNTGPRAPMIQRVKRVFDPNTGEIYQPEDQLGGVS